MLLICSDRRLQLKQNGLSEVAQEPRSHLQLGREMMRFSSSPAESLFCSRVQSYANR